MERRALAAAVAVYLAASVARDFAGADALPDHDHRAAPAATTLLSGGVRAVDADHPERALSVQLDGEPLPVPHALHYSFCTA